jgi:hypothetical protein
LKLQYDEPLSNFAFDFNLRRYSAELLRAKAGRSKLSVSTPVFNAPMVSALETRIS